MNRQSSGSKSPDPLAKDIPSSEISVSILSGVGKDRTAKLAKLGINSLYHLWTNRPKRYEDRRTSNGDTQWQEGSYLAFKAILTNSKVKFLRGRGQSLFEAQFESDHLTVRGRWWNMGFLKRLYPENKPYFIYGKIATTAPLTINHPELEPIEEESEENQHIHMDRIVPVYKLTSGIQQRWLRQLIFDSLPLLSRHPFEGFPAFANENDSLFQESVEQLHFPNDLESVEKTRRFFAWKEALSFQEKIQNRRKKFIDKGKAPACHHDNHLVKPFLSQLPFTLTASQVQVLKEIRSDLNQKHPMRRLLQGDVGAGKTVVAAISALMVLESGFDVALMAPTEILAKQHFQSFGTWLNAFPIECSLWTGSEKHSNETDEARITIGTHALIESGYHSDKLGFVIIDEQHKFGVSQREKLVKKGRYPHLLVMTATPIPRTLGLTIYGDLDVSSLKEVPKGRGKIKSYLRTQDSQEQVRKFVQSELAKGHQAYIVYPKIGKPSDAASTSLLGDFEKLQKDFPDYQLALLHGQVSAEETETTMRDFRNGKIHLLACTTVIEVGLDVSNATVMIVEGADHFGLSQLHQLRGRVGRGAHQSYCIAMADDQKKDSWERLIHFTESRDGFEIAEADFKARGPGEFTGKMQSGLPRWSFLDLNQDREIIANARNAWRKHLELD